MRLSDDRRSSMTVAKKLIVLSKYCSCVVARAARANYSACGRSARRRVDVQALPQ